MGMNAGHFHTSSYFPELQDRKISLFILRTNIHLPRVMKYYPQLAEGIMIDLWRDFWIRETGTGQQVAQLRERYIMIIIIIIIMTTTTTTNIHWKFYAITYKVKKILDLGPVNCWTVQSPTGGIRFSLWRSLVS